MNLPPLPTERPDIGQPHTKPYMPSKLGRALERASYRDIALASTAVLVLSTIYLARAPQGHGIAQSGVQTSSFLDAAYFSVVTLTSLGYGDYVPEGVGRLVACGLVLFGLVAVAFFIGKLASERSQATLFLLHTSDRDRRLRGFAAAIAGEREKLTSNLSNSQIEEIRRQVQDLTGILEGISNYVAFHGHHSSLGDYGNAPALYRMLLELRMLSRPILDAMLLPATDIDLQKRLDATINRIVSLVRLVIAMQSHRVLDWTGTALVGIGLTKPTIDISKAQSRLENGLLAEVERGRLKAATALTEALLAGVLAKSAPGPLQSWPEHDHKRIAAHLGVSNKLVVRSIAELRAQGRLPKPRNGLVE
jgi:hypothetical protein